MSAVDWVLLSNTKVKVGDLISTDAGGMPVYRVVALREGAALVEGAGASSHTVTLDHFTWKLARAY
jgi:hypothetical protein